MSMLIYTIVVLLLNSALVSSQQASTRDSLLSKETSAARQNPRKISPDEQNRLDSDKGKDIFTAFPFTKRKRSHARSIDHTTKDQIVTQEQIMSDELFDINLESQNISYWMDLLATIDVNDTMSRVDYEISTHCNRFQPPRDFYVIGHAGGDPLRHCENTLEATRSALDDGGANAIELDLSMSKDGVIFLWHDPHPMGILSLVRRFGFALNGQCRPKMVVNKPSHEMNFKEIQDHWYYEDVANNGRRNTKIPTLEQWFNHFASDPRIRLIWLDVKVNVESKMSFFVNKLVKLLNKFNISHDRLQFSVREVNVGALLQEKFIHAGHPQLASLVVTDTQAVVPYVTNDIVHRFDGIAKASPPIRNENNLQCGCCASLGLPFAVASRWESFKQIVNFNVMQRNNYKKLTNSHIRIYTYTINNPEQMDWLLNSGVDGIITNHPKLLSSRILRQYQRNEPRNFH